MNAAATPATFIQVLSEFVETLTRHFPDNTGAAKAKGMLDMFRDVPSTHDTIVKSWYRISAPILEDIKNRNAEPVARALNGCDNPLIADIRADTIICNDAVSAENKEAAWKYCETLTALSQILCRQESMLGQPIAQAPAQPSAAPVAAPAPAAAAPAAAKPKPGDVIKQITTAMPEIFKSLNEMMKDGGDDNPMGQMLRQMMNPNQLQTGMAGNVAQNMMDGDTSSVMQQASLETGLTTDEILFKLKRLDNFEKARARRQKKKN